MKKTKNPVEVKTFDFYKEFEKIKTEPNFISFDKFMATVLLKVDTNFESSIYKKFNSAFEEAFLNKYEMKFEKFVITFNINLKFSEKTLVPMLSKMDTSNTQTLNFTTAKEPEYNTFLKALNEVFATLLAQNFIIELLPDLIIFNSEHINSTKLFFGEKWALELNRESQKDAN
ncbi:MSC_0623 family F1-like ATPase-associated protein [Metamycoplasma equirhinis]|uniref:MSC_0623 family F1-like ATPase-associated protein n=1 Tax=Metamycoplasma equirhinis TaxID=92402 RepID=UPI0035938227